MTKLLPRPATMRTEGLGVDLHHGDEVCVLRLQGALTESTVDQADPVIEVLAEGTCHSVLLDASLLWELDATGVAFLLALQDQIASRQARLVVYAATGSVARALDGSAIRQ